MATVYVETSVIGYLTSRPSRDLVVAGHQQVTRTWWDFHRQRYRLVVSPAVWFEVSAGDAVAAGERQATLAGLEVLDDSADVQALAARYVKALQIPAKAAVDALHIAFAVTYAVDFLATWNLKHIANGDTMRRLAAFNLEAGLATPLIVTPESLMPPEPKDAP